ncbi:hypothetical protein [Caminibacter pacificus]
MRYIIIILSLLLLGCEVKKQTIEYPKIDFIQNSKINYKIFNEINVNEFPFVGSEICGIKTFKLNASNIKNINNKNIFQYRYIYVPDIWVKNFKNRKDFLKSLSATFSLNYNTLLKWLKQGGILWVQGGIFSSGYEYVGDFEKSKKLLISKTKNINFFNEKMPKEILEAKKIDFINFSKLKKKYKNLTLEKNYYALVYFLKPSAIYEIIKFDEGFVVFLRDYDYCNKWGYKIRIDILNKISEQFEFYALKYKNNRFSLNEVQKFFLNQVVENIKKYPWRKIDIIYAKGLKNQTRAILVADYFQNQGLDKEKINFKTNRINPDIIYIRIENE